jgi:hypothetical protein
MPTYKIFSFFLKEWFFPKKSFLSIYCSRNEKKNHNFEWIFNQNL